MNQTKTAGEQAMPAKATFVQKHFGNMTLGEGIDRYGAIAVLLIMVVLASSVSDVFFTSKNILNVLRQVSANGIISIGLLMVILTGGIDISVGSIVGVVSVMFALLFDPTVAVSPFTGMVTVLSSIVPGGQVGAIIVSIIIVLIIGGLLGFLNGLVICKCNIQPFIMTIGTLTLYRGIALLIPNGRPVYMTPETTAKVGVMGEGRVLGIPVPVIVLAVLTVAFMFLLSRTTFGRYIRAIGNNQEAARVAGINIDKLKIIAYSLCGVMAAVAGYLLTARTTTGEPNLGATYEMDAIAACVIGGARLTGGIGTIGGTIIGAIIIGILNNMLNLANVSAYYQYVVRGLIIILAVAVRSTRHKR